MGWIATTDNGQNPWNGMAAWRLVDAAEQVAGWLVEPAVADGQIELLTASLQLSQAAELVVDRAETGRLHVPKPDGFDLHDACLELLGLVQAAREQATGECSEADDPVAARLGQAALLLDDAHRTIEGALR